MFFIELGEIKYIDDYMRIYDNARKFMEKNGNKNQWIDGYPSKEIILSDIKNKNFYVLKSKLGIEAIFSFIEGIDPTYLNIFNGNRNDNSNYFVIHRFASNFLSNSTFKRTIEWCKTKTNHIRIDTSKDNLPMQKAIMASQFKYCGIIHLENGDERLAYEYISLKS